MLSINELRQRSAKRAKLLEEERTSFESETANQLAELKENLKKEAREAWVKTMSDEWDGRTSGCLEDVKDESWKIYATMRIAADYRKDGTCGASDAVIIKWFVDIFGLEHRAKLTPHKDFLEMDSSTHSSGDDEESEEEDSSADSRGSNARD
jgi:hypothetical protein